ncbi:hypothetical protein ACFSFW_15940 [Fredinandcohnia salidurans]|uniref:Uncharacterized protein n=1 Tax=Fredinandcohnia salidurans TaxID=2595041 RepID=A0ABW4MRH2_9BACI
MLFFAFVVIIAIYISDKGVGEVDVLAFVGSILGGVLTLGGVYLTITSSFEGLRKQFDFEHNKLVEANRSYITVQQLTAPFKLHNVETGYKSRIILTRDYERFIDNHNDEDLKEIDTSFYKFSIHGIPEIVIDCKIVITLTKPGTEELLYIESNIGMIEKDEELFIPCYVDDSLKELEPVKIEAEYTTLSDERIHFEFDARNMVEGYWLLKDGQKETIFQFTVQNSDWIFPNRKKNQ